MCRARTVVAVLLIALAGLPATADAALPGVNGRVAFAGYGDQSYEIYVLQPNGTTITPITSNATPDLSPNLSPNGTKVAWVGGGSDRNDIYVAPADGSGTPDNLTDFDANTFAYSPAWSPDGTKIAYTTDAVGKIFVMSASGTGDPTVISAPGLQDIRSVSWSPSGGTIAFDGRLPDDPSKPLPTFNTDVYTVPADGSAEPTRVTTGADVDAEPDWSPDGSSLVFLSDRDAPPAFKTKDVYVIPAAGGTAVRRTTSGNIRSPVFSPDGTRIAYTDGTALLDMPAGGGAASPLANFEGSAIADLHWGAPGPQPPKSLTRPVISGNIVTGGSVSCSDGTWGNTPTSFAYTWRRDDQVVAMTKGYTLVAADEGRPVTCTVVATNDVGDTSASSDPITPTSPGAVEPPANVVPPGVSGTAMDGQTLGSDVGQWNGTPPIGYFRHWLRCDAEGAACETIPNELGETYVVTPADIGHRLRLRVTANNAAASVSADSEPTAIVRAEPPRNLTPPTINGTFESSHQLTATTGTWAGTQPLQFSYRWFKCNINGCTTSRVDPYYNVGETDKRYSIYVEVTATNAGGSTSAISQAGRVLADLRCDLDDTALEHLCGKTPVVFIPGFGASVIRCTNLVGQEAMLWPSALVFNPDFVYMHLAPDGVSPGGVTPCTTSAGPSGEVVKTAAGVVNIHGESQAWLQRMAPGRAYVFGWDWRKGPDQTLERLDNFIEALRSRHGVRKVAILNHSYGGMLTRWYIDSPGRAGKVVRVANIASPFWGSPKAWFAMAHGYETPDQSEMDFVINNLIFKAFTRNLTGLYYLFPSRSWFSSAPLVLRRWLEVAEQPRDFDQTLDAVAAFDGNAALARRAADGHRDHLDGFKGMTRAGVDWRTFAGSGLPTLGHIREGDDPQYSWINGDKTVPLISQRQFASDPAAQQGERVPTYYFCGIGHMDEPETPALQSALQGFLLDGADVSYDGTVLRREPCRLAATEFHVTGAEDAKSVAITAIAGAQSDRAALRAAGSPLTLRAARAADLVDYVEVGGNVRTFVTLTPQPLSVTLPKGAAVRITPLTGDGKKGRPVLYGPLAASATITVARTRVTRAVSRGRTLRPARADSRPPRTTARVRRRGASALLTPVVRDASPVRASYIKVGSTREKRWRTAVRVPRRSLKKVRIHSVDVFGNVERPHRP